MAEPKTPKKQAAKKGHQSIGCAKNPVDASNINAKGPIVIKIPAVAVNGFKPDNLVFTMCKLKPYKNVANTTQSAW